MKLNRGAVIFAAGCLISAALIPISKIDTGTVPDAPEDVPVIQEVSPEPEAEPSAEPSPEPYIYSDDVPLSEEYQEVFQDACREYGVPYNLALGLAEVESGFTFSAWSGSAYGIMQIAPINYNWLYANGIDATTNEGNIEAGIYMLGMFLEKYDDTHKALMAYNCGEAGAAELWEKGQTTSDYSAKVVAAAAKWKEVINE